MMAAAKLENVKTSAKFVNNHQRVPEFRYKYKYYLGIRHIFQQRKQFKKKKVYSIRKLKMFGKKPTTKEVVKQQKRNLNKSGRDLERDYKQLERQEKATELEIKKAAKQGNRQLATTLAKQLIGIRKQKARNMNTKSKVSGIGNQMTTMQANVKMAESMGTATQAMGAMNKQMDVQKLGKTLQEFERESAKMEMSEEMMGDSLDDLLGGSDDEEEEDAIVSQVLDEIGIEITGKLSSLPATGSSLPQSSKSKMSDEDKEIESMLAKLKAS